MKQYLKQTVNLFKENPVQSIIPVLGTALAVAMIAAILMANRTEYMDYTPEVDRSKTLYVKWIGLREKSTNQIVRNGNLSQKTVDECFRTLNTPRYVTASMPIEIVMASAFDTRQHKCYVRPTDDVFWKAYQFTFTEGSPYNQADFDAGIKKIVVSRKFIRQLLGTDKNVTGRQIQLNFMTFTIAGVVEDVSALLDYSYAQAWIPFTSIPTPPPGDKEGVTGKLICQIIPHSSSDIKTIRKEIDKQISRFNSGLSDVQADLFGQPDLRFKETKRFGPGNPPMRSMIIKDIATILVIFIIPAINLSGFTASRMRKRLPELGVRRAFGGTRTKFVRQIIFENTFYSIIGGILGLMLSALTLFLIKGKYGLTSNMYWGMDVDIEIPFFMLFNWVNFLIAFGFCLLMNLASACVPAWRISSLPIVESLNEK